MDNRPIGVFDSGVGGITVVNEILKYLPDEKIIYLGDTKRAPYGEKIKEMLVNFSETIINFLLNKNCKAIVIACNTVSTNCLLELKNKFNIHIIDVVNPSINETIENTEKNVAVLATKATVKSGMHKKLINNLKPELNVYYKACPIFVPIVEEGFVNTDMPYLAALEYLKEFENKNIDTFVLGCTHYPIILESIKKVIGYDKIIIDPADSTAKELKTILHRNNMFSNEKSSEHEIFFTGDNDNFENTVKNLLSCDYFIKEVYL